MAITERGRIRIESIDGGTRVTIGPPRGSSEWFNLFVVTFAFCISLVTSVGFTTGLISGKEHFPVDLAMLCIFALLLLLFFAFLLLASLWNLFGDEVIALNGTVLVITGSLFGRQFARTFDVDRISAFRVERRTYRNKMGLRVRGVITFDYRGKKVDAQRFVSGGEGQTLLDGPFRAIAARDAR